MVWTDRFRRSSSRHQPSIVVATAAATATRSAYASSSNMNTPSSPDKDDASRLQADADAMGHILERLGALLSERHDMEEEVSKAQRELQQVNWERFAVPLSSVWTSAVASPSSPSSSYTRPRQGTEPAHPPRPSTSPAASTGYLPRSGPDTAGPEMYHNDQPIQAGQSRSLGSRMHPAHRQAARTLRHRFGSKDSLRAAPTPPPPPPPLTALSLAATPPLPNDAVIVQKKAEAEVIRRRIDQLCTSLDRIDADFEPLMEVFWRCLYAKTQLDKLRKQRNGLNGENGEDVNINILNSKAATTGLAFVSSAVAPSPSVSPSPPPSPPPPPVPPLPHPPPPALPLVQRMPPILEPADVTAPSGKKKETEKSWRQGRERERERGRGGSGNSNSTTGSSSSNNNSGGGRRVASREQLREQLQQLQQDGREQQCSWEQDHHRQGTGGRGRERIVCATTAPSARGKSLDISGGRNKVEKGGRRLFEFEDSGPNMPSEEEGEEEEVKWI